MKPEYKLFGRTTVEKRYSCSKCFRYVLRYDFVNESSFSATITVEDRPIGIYGFRTIYSLIQKALLATGIVKGRFARNMYVCIALSKGENSGYITRMITDTRQYFKDEGYTHAEYVIDTVEKRTEL